MLVEQHIIFLQLEFHYIKYPNPKGVFVSRNDVTAKQVIKESTPLRKFVAVRIFPNTNTPYFSR